jgi:Transposase
MKGRCPQSNEKARGKSQLYHPPLQWWDSSATTTGFWCCTLKLVRFDCEKLGHNPREKGACQMPEKKFSDEQIAFALRQAEGGTAVGEICRKMSIAEATF